jgi:hypothetical protein
MRTYLPKAKEFRRAAAAFRKRYPWVKTYIAWNEANHCSQPTCKKPERAAQYYDALRAVCRGCTVVAPAVLDQPNMVKWLARFRKAAKSSRGSTRCTTTSTSTACARAAPGAC